MDKTEKYVCERCGHEFNDITNFRRHLIRKNVCENKLSNVDIETLREKYLPVKKEKNILCPTCDKKFSTSSGLYLHKKKCTFKKTGESLQLQDIIDKFNEQQELLDYLMNKFSSSNQQPTSSSITINNIHNQNIYNIVYNNYGSEDLSYIRDNHELLINCINNPRSGMKQLIENIHFHPEHPENYTIRNKSLKQKIFEKRIDNEWVPCDLSNTLDELIRKGYRVLSTYYYENIVNDPYVYEDEIRFEALKKFHFLADTSCNDYFSVKRDVKLLIVDKTAYLLEGQDNN
jgi:hypothetical protein